MLWRALLGAVKQWMRKGHRVHNPDTIGLPAKISQPGQHPTLRDNRAGSKAACNHPGETAAGSCSGWLSAAAL